METKQVVAIKILNLDTLDDEVQDVQQEITLLSKLAKSEVQNIINYHGSFLSGSKLWIIMDYCSGGSVRTLLKAGRIEERYSAVIIREMLIALQYIHKEGIIHRDIKAANVLISRDGHVQLCDFGVAAQLTAAKLKRTSMIGTPYWMAPEVIQEGSSYNQKADIWSLGITLYEIITGSPPYADQDIKRAVYLIPRSKPTRLEGSQYSQPLKEFVAMCLDEQVDARPSAEELLKSRFIRNTRTISYSILKDLISRYQQWRENNKNVRDSFISTNGYGASFSDEDEDDSSSFDWDFDTSSDNESSFSTTTAIASNTTTSRNAHVGTITSPQYSRNENQTQKLNVSNIKDVKGPMESFSQEPTFKAVDAGYLSSNFTPSSTSSIPTSFNITTASQSFNRVDKHPLLEMFDEEPGDSSSNDHRERKIDIDPSDGTSKKNDRVIPSNMSLPPTVKGPLAPFTPPFAGIQHPTQSYTQPMEIEIPSIDDLGSHSLMNTPATHSQQPNSNNTGSTSTATNNLTSGPTATNSNLSPQFSLVNHTLPLNPSVSSASTPNLPTLVKSSISSNGNKISITNRPDLNSLGGTTSVHNTLNKPSFIQPPHNIPVSSIHNGLTQQLTTSASDINISVSFTHQAPPPISSLSNMTRRTPSPKRAGRQASISNTQSSLSSSMNAPLPTAALSSVPTNPVKSSRKASVSSQWQLGAIPVKNYPTDETGDSTLASSTSKTYNSQHTNSISTQSTPSLVSSFSATSLPTMANSISTASSLTSLATPDGLSGRDVPLSTAHLKHLAQRKLSVSSSTPTSALSSPSLIATSRGQSHFGVGSVPVPYNNSSIISNETAPQQLDSDQTDLKQVLPLSTQNMPLHLPSKNNLGPNSQSQHSTNTRSSETNDRSTRIQQYQQQQYNQQLQHLQQQQLQASLSSNNSSILTIAQGYSDHHAAKNEGDNTDKEGLTAEHTSNVKENSRKAGHPPGKVNTEAIKDEDSSLHNNSAHHHYHHNTQHLGTSKFLDETNEATNTKGSNIHTGTDHTTGSVLSSKTLKKSYRLQTEDNNSTQSGNLNKGINYKVQFPPLTALNCDILLDSLSKEVVVNELSNQLGIFVNALDAIEQQLSAYITEF